MDDMDKTIAPRREHVSSGADDVTMPGKRDRKPDGRFAIGDLIMNRYKVLAELGQGGMGVVYKCFDETAGIEVALKALPPELSHNTLEMEDIKDNFQLVHNLHHPNIASSNNLERDNSNGNYYLIMECCEGEDLRRWIKHKRKEGELKLKDVLPIVKQVADALDYAHKQKIIHRDIKPGNIMINAAGDIKVLDFGLAAQIHTSMTRVSMAYHGTSGTGPYMAPEQWRGRAQGAPADQYALAVMTYEMLAGHLPFESSDATVLREAVLNDTPEEIADIPKTAQDAIKCAMSKEPAERFENCSDFATALGGKKIKAAKKQSKGVFPKWAAVLIIATLLGIGGAGYYFFDQHQKEQTEQDRLEAERKNAEEQKRIDKQRKKDEEQKRIDEQRKKDEEQKRIDEQRKKAEEQKRIDEQRKKAEEQKRIDEQRKKVEEQKRIDEQRKKAEGQKRIDEQRKKAEEQKRLAEQHRKNKELKELEKESREDFRNKNYSSALEKLLKLPNHSPEQLFQIAICYENRNDITNAKKYFILAYNQKYYDADCNLGNLFTKSQEWIKAVEYYESILNIDKNNSIALRSLAVIYLSRYGTDHEQQKGKRYLEKAAETGDGKSMYNLGCCYAKFKGVDFPVFAFSQKKAIYWLERAHASGIKDAEEKLKLLR